MKLPSLMSLGPGLIVVFAVEVLAAADEDQGLLQGRVVRADAGGFEGVEEHLRVGQVGTRFAVVAGPAEEVVLAVLPSLFVPLQLLEKFDRVADDRLVLVRLIGLTRAITLMLVT